MNEKEFQRIMNEKLEYDEEKENSLKTMLHQFYNRKMKSIVILVWGYAIAFIALCVYSGIMFFKAESVKFQLVYAVIFMIAVHFIGLLKNIRMADDTQE